MGKNTLLVLKYCPERE